MTLGEIRSRIDAIDSQLLELLNQRADLVHEVGVLKKRDNVAIYAPEREEQLLRSLVERNHGRLPASAIRAIYREIMSASFALEKGLTIAFLGPVATWSHQAAREKFGASVQYAAQSSIAEVFNVVARGAADYGVVPIENSTEGAVSYTLDQFMDSELRVCAQFSMKIENNLIANIAREEIRTVYSHPQVIGQCRQWLRHNLPHVDLIEVSSTTRAAELASKEPHAAALAGRMAAEVYRLDILEASIQDSPNNTTRFLIIGPNGCPPTGDDKTSLMFSVQDKPGALFLALAPFKDLRINMSKIESRPSKRKAWEYFFFVDVDGHAEEPALVQALAELQKHCSFVKILGSYPKSGQP
ncbi:MAG TPA: prephenate dehydratase [Chthoniobacteraceae bacterium]|jgi:chorismate mutase/prephenate dehydratase|nr:prephenate dehydratase [Chthoniobacteraceae bacterium]